MLLVVDHHEAGADFGAVVFESDAVVFGGYACPFRERHVYVGHLYV
jgi:hypothetical protein